MKTITAHNKIVFIGDKTPEDKLRSELSEILIKKFGKGPYNERISNEIIVLCLNFYVDEFILTCKNENSYRFYQTALMFHEDATELAHFHQGSEEVDMKYIATYRRVLKFILETGCDVKMTTKGTVNKQMKHRFEKILNKLIFIGEMILMCVDLYAEQSMIEDVVDITFDAKQKYVFGRKHHYEFIFEHMNKELGSHLEKLIVDDSEYAGLTDLKVALKNCFNINYDDVGSIVGSIHEQLKPIGGQHAGFGWDSLPLSLNKYHNVPLEVAENFFKGLTLDRNNKMSLKDLACKPYKINRYLYKPIIVWNIDGKEYAHLGKNSYTESIIQYSTNAIPWGKTPIECKQNECFKKYVHSKEDDHDKWLDNALEEKLKELNIPYDIHVRNLRHHNGNTNIDVEGLGEIDFIFLSQETNTIYITDCKHLLGRYDMPNQRNDFNSFSIGSRKNKSYNETMETKLKWLNNNRRLLIEHFKLKYKNCEFDFSSYAIEGIFIVNTPTFYMYNAKYRIYTISQIEDVILNKYKDPTFTVSVSTETEEKIILVKYPYFQKPKYIIIDDDIS